MRYIFLGLSCPGAPEGKCCQHEIEYPMAKAPDLGKKRRCPRKGCGGAVARVMSTGILCHVKGSAHDWKPGETMRMKMNGLDYGFSFVDHPHTDPKYQRNLAQLAGQAGLGGTAHGMSNARYDEKSGQMVVDVMSDIRDPLGAIERSKKTGDYQQKKIAVNQPFKVRKPKAKK